MLSEKDFKIPFEGLKIGSHEFEYELNDAFFKLLSSGFVEKGDLALHFKLDKKERMMLGHFEFTGEIIHPCDLCNDDVNVPLNGSFDIVFKFGNEDSEDENLIMVADSQFEIDLFPLCNEFIAAMLPSKITHEEGDCNEDMLKLLDKYSTEDDNVDVDPRWDALRKLN